MRCFLCKERCPRLDPFVYFNNKTEPVRKYIIIFSYPMFKDLMAAAASKPIICHKCVEAIKQEAKLKLEMLDKKFYLIPSKKFDIDTIDVSRLDNDNYLKDDKDDDEEDKVATLLCENFGAELLATPIEKFFVGANNSLRMFYAARSAEMRKLMKK